MTAMIAPRQSALRRTPLHDLHVAMGARMAPFVGYEMPIQYPLGVMKEYLHTRAQAGLFDVSHMGQIALRPRNGTLADVALALERLVPVDVLGLAAGRQRYAFFTDASGGIIDDLMIARCGDHIVLVVNAGRKVVDEAHLRAAVSQTCNIEVLENRALLALQGPGAEGVLARLAPDIAAMGFMDVRLLAIAGTACVVTRSGYTGEDGFEISVAADDAEKLARTFLENASVALAGLGARDSLRTEAGLCLFGSDIDESTTPIEAALEWAMQQVRRRGCGVATARYRSAKAPRRPAAAGSNARSRQRLQSTNGSGRNRQIKPASIARAGSRVPDWLAVGVALTLPWSTSATAIFIALWIIAVLPTLVPFSRQPPHLVWSNLPGTNRQWQKMRRPKPPHLMI